MSSLAEGADLSRSVVLGGTLSLARGAILSRGDILSSTLQDGIRWHPLSRMVEDGIPPSRNDRGWPTSGWYASYIECFLVTFHKRSLRRLCFYTCLSVHRGLASQPALQVVSQHALQVFGGRGARAPLPPSWWLLPRAVRILLECIVVFYILGITAWKWKQNGLRGKSASVLCLPPSPPSPICHCPGTFLATPNLCLWWIEKLSIVNKTPTCVLGPVSGVQWII